MDVRLALLMTPTKGETLIAETRLLWNSAWPKPLCPRGGVHDFLEYPRGWVCDHCGGVIKSEDSKAVLSWWFHVHEFVTEAWVRN